MDPPACTCVPVTLPLPTLLHNDPPCLLESEPLGTGDDPPLRFPDPFGDCGKGDDPLASFSATMISLLKGEDIPHSCTLEDVLVPVMV